MEEMGVMVKMEEMEEMVVLLVHKVALNYIIVMVNKNKRYILNKGI